MAEITLESLTKVYPDGTEAMTGLDLAIGNGEFVVFVVPPVVARPPRCE